MASSRRVLRPVAPDEPGTADISVRRFDRSVTSSGFGRRTRSDGQSRAPGTVGPPTGSGIDGSSFPDVPGVATPAEDRVPQRSVPQDSDDDRSADGEDRGEPPDACPRLRSDVWPPWLDLTGTQFAAQSPEAGRRRAGRHTARSPSWAIGARGDDGGWSFSDTPGWREGILTSQNAHLCRSSGCARTSARGGNSAPNPGGTAGVPTGIYA